MLRGVILIIALLVLPTQAAARDGLQHYLFLGGDRPEDHSNLLSQDEIAGAQIVYSWRSLEGDEGEYDFAQIEADLAALQAMDRKLFIQIQDRFFLSSARRLPDYILNEPLYGGGLARQADNAGEGLEGSGWVAMQWIAPLRHRFQALISALAERFDGRIAGINLPESAADPDMENPPPGFSCDAYFAATLENISHARRAFLRSHVVQYANFWPCEWDNDQGYMGRIFDAAAEQGFGLGGPDIVPERRAQMKNSYPFFNRYRGQLALVAMAVQEPTLTYTDPSTGKPFTGQRIEDYARDYLGVDILFWTFSAPWLNRAE